MFTLIVFKNIYNKNPNCFIHDKTKLIRLFIENLLMFDLNQRKDLYPLFSEIKILMALLGFYWSRII